MNIMVFVVEAAQPDRFTHGGAGILAGIIVGAVFLAYQYASGRL